MGYLSLPALKNLKNIPIKVSLVSRFLLTPYWNWFIKLFPLNIAPNTITLLGLCIVAFNVITLLYYDPLYLTEKDGATGPPQWIYFTWAIGLFMYQSLDAVDGKQARRTGMAGPLGEMFDHGLRALVLEVVLASRALNLGRSWWTVASQIATLANFYLTTWEEYHTGTLYLGPFSGPVEGILMIVIIYVITGIFGPTFWDTKILTFTHLDRIPQVVQNVPNIGLNESFMVFAAFALAFNIVSSNLPDFWLLSPSHHDSAIIHSPLFLPFLCAWGLQFAHQVGRMILSHITRAPFPLWHSMWLWSVIGVVDAQLPFLFGSPSLIQSTPKRTAMFIYLTLAISFITYARFCALVIRDITEFLGIACFTVRKKDGEGVWRETRDIQHDGTVVQAQ
ncbi:hypothetical protein BDR07DRAFT_1450115 [Suillus spraguei]|nr:hypothetical protein BDR07DRAFT_1450115 [Suillus spraguei]